MYIRIDIISHMQNITRPKTSTLSGTEGWTHGQSDETTNRCTDQKT